MKIVTTNYRLLLLLSSIFLIGGCSTKDNNIEVSQVHLYNNNYGVVPDSKADEIIASEIASEDEPVETDYSSLDPRYTTELEKDPDAFVGEDWVPPKPKITYKYMDDPHFYTEDELPKNKLRVGNIIDRSETEDSLDNTVLYSRR